MTKTRKTNKVKQEDLAPDRGRNTEKFIPIHELEDWVGHVPNLYKIDAVYLGWDNRFRINVYCSKKVEGSIYERYSIDKSYHVRYTDGRFEDKSRPTKGCKAKYI